MTRLMGWLWNRALLYVLLVVVIGATLLFRPQLGDLPRLFEEETQSHSQIIAQIAQARAQTQREFDTAATNAKAMSLTALDQRIKQREADLIAAKATLAESRKGFFANYRPNKLLAGKRAEFEIAAITQELRLLRAHRADRKGRSWLGKNAISPAAVKAAKQKCDDASAALKAFKARTEPSRIARQTIFNEQTDLERQVVNQCKIAASIARTRNAQRQIENQRSNAAALINTIVAQPLPEDLADTFGRVTVRDILLQAMAALALITATPFVYRVIAYHVLAPMAARWPPMRFGPAGTAPFGEGPAPGSEKSMVSVTITLGPDDEALVRQDYLQSSSLTGTKRTRWLLDWGHPLTSFASGMRFLTAVRGAGERVTLSAVKDPFAELAVLAVPEGAACVLRPSALAGVVQTAGEPVRITSHWRIFSLPALLTWQWRYLAFHGPARLVVKGGRGVRIEPAARGRIVGEGQMIGFSAGLAYAVIRSETFWPYFFGREVLLKDRLEAGDGVVLIEEAPLAGRSGIRRGFEGVADAVLKLGGI